jgi:phenylalanyl-tRNA synthetase alpha chain
MTDTTGFPELDALRVRVEALAALDQAALEQEEIALLGRKVGVLTALLKSVATRAPDERRAFGAAVNAIKQAAETHLAARQAALQAAARAARDAGVDLSMPGRRRWTGIQHPVTAVIDEIVEIFRGLGFSVALGPEVETEWYNFLALNFPADHPTMDLHDTLYLDAPPVTGESGAGARLLLRTHTSPVQVRVMHDTAPPIRVVMPGMVYRSDPFDPSHAPAFAQVEGLVVDEGISLVDLKATLTHFARRFFSATTKVRFRPSYFPFTEPSAEMDVECQLCHGSGCSACKGSGWMEILGAGMVHPRVLEEGRIDPERYTGFAFGMGPARIAMLRHGVRDIRLLYEGDMRFLGQFAEDAHP